MYSKTGENDYPPLAAYMNELEQIAGKSKAESCYTRNFIIHGGDTKYTIRAIDFLKELGETIRVRNASKGFAITYKISMGNVQAIFANALAEIVELLNK